LNEMARLVRELKVIEYWNLVSEENTLDIPFRARHFREIEILAQLSALANKQPRPLSRPLGQKLLPANSKSKPTLV
jgi:hypothetical protein